MSEERFDLVFGGELVRGADPAQARKNIGNLFKITEAKVEALFSGKPVTLKKGLDFATANKYLVAIKKAGCRVDVVECKASALKGKTNFAPAEPEQPITDESKQKPPEAQPEVSHAVAADETQLSESSPEVVEQPATITEHAGSFLSDYAEVQTASDDMPPLPVVEEVSVEDLPSLSGEPEPLNDNAASAGATGGGLTIAPAEGNLVDTSELDHPEQVQVHISEDVSVREPGADLLNDEEKVAFVPRDIALHADLAPIGADLVLDGEREQVEPVQVDISGLSIAEAGVDLGEEKDELPALHPDISHLSIE